MKITTLLTLFIALLLAVPLVDVAAQQKEGALISGQIALRFSAGGKGSTYVLLQKRGDEDALVFPVVHYHAVLYAQAPGCNGLMYVTPSRIIFDSQTKKSHSFDILRTEIKKVESQKSARFGKNIGNHIFIDAKDGSKRFAVMFENSSDVGFQGDYMKPVLEFFDLAVTDFAAATKQFHELTAKIRKAQSEANAAAQLRAQIEALRAQMETKTREEYDKAFNETLLHKEELQRLPLSKIPALFDEAHQ